MEKSPFFVAINIIMKNNRQKNFDFYKKNLKLKQKFFEEIESEQANSKEKKQIKKKNRRTASEIQKDFQVSKIQ